MARVNLRMQHITGLTVKTAELLQVWLVSGSPGVGKGVFLARCSSRVLRARHREACPVNCRTAECYEYGVASCWEARIKYAHWHSTISIEQMSTECLLCAQVSYSELGIIGGHGSPIYVFLTTEAEILSCFRDTSKSYKYLHRSWF